MKKSINFIGILTLAFTMMSCVGNIFELNRYTENKSIVTVSLGLMRNDKDGAEYTVRIIYDKEKESAITVLQNDKLFNQTECIDYPLGPSEIILKKTEKFTPETCRLKAILEVDPQKLEDKQKINFCLKITNSENPGRCETMHFNSQFMILNPDIQNWENKKKYLYDFTYNVTDKSLILNTNGGDLI